MGMHTFRAFRDDLKRPGENSTEKLGCVASRGGFILGVGFEIKQRQIINFCFHTTPPAMAFLGLRKWPTPARPSRASDLAIPS
jgi:hypothetical protein